MTDPYFPSHSSRPVAELVVVPPVVPVQAPRPTAPVDGTVAFFAAKWWPR